MALTVAELRPRLVACGGGGGDSGGDQLERFSHYVARQLGLGDGKECPQVLKLASDYLQRAKDCDENIFSFFASSPDAEALCVKFVQELDRCILAYFAFHWDRAPSTISQVLQAEKDASPKAKLKLKSFVLEATRKQRFERVTRNLKVTRVFSTLLDEMKAIGITSNSDTAAAADGHCTDVMAPVAHSERSPVLLLMGGGMGAGKSTVLKDILKEAFWSGAAAGAVVVEADAFKEKDVIYRAISSKGHHGDMLQTAELVHQTSTDAASSLLVTALNDGRDVIMDGTLSWMPFVEQTVAMARAVHKQRYRMGPGYRVDPDDGTVTEQYWEPAGDDEPAAAAAAASRKPYRIEIVGVVCDAYLAVVRAIRRAIIMGRAVRVKSQLRSHRSFAAAFPTYCRWVDAARLYSTNSMGSAQLIAWKETNTGLLIDPKEFSCLEKLSRLDDSAVDVFGLYGCSGAGDTTCGAKSVWDDLVAAPSRRAVQEELKEAILAAEGGARGNGNGNGES